MRRLVALLAVAMVVVAGWYFGSQYYALYDLREAARSGDAAALDRRVDFAAFQASLSGRIEEDLAGRTARSDSPLARFGGAIAGELSNSAVERLVTPENIARLIETGQATGIRVSRRENPEWSIEHRRVDSFRLVAGDGDGVLVFRRHGLGWQLAGLERGDG